MMIAFLYINHRIATKYFGYNLFSHWIDTKIQSQNLTTSKFSHWNNSDIVFIN